MTTSRIRPGTWADAMHVAEHMRAADAAECVAAGEPDLVLAVTRSVEHTTAYWTWEVDGEPACLFGYFLPTLLGSEARTWLFTTPLVERHKFAFVRQARLCLEVVSERFPVLHGLVDVRYRTCVRWLRWMGFLVQGEVVLNGNPFHEYWLLR